MKRMNRTIAMMMTALMLAGQVSGTTAFAADTASQTEEAEAPAYEQNTLQMTRYGALQGFEQDGTLQWFGVPYAQTPVGDLRWKAPVEVEPWEGVREATESLMGSQMGTVDGNRVLLGSEEGAVSLDIYRPNTDETGLPIFFYLHGGNNQTGKSAALPATQMAQELNAVIISVNTRLGLLGFNALPAIKNGTEEENSGNFTLLDLAASLDWVAANAESFGGDPSNITVTGSSSGGRDVMAMLISPMFEGKFQKAISFSGGMTVADVTESQKVEARALAPLAVEKGVQTDEAEAQRWLMTDGDDVREFLYSLTDEELANAFGGAAIRMAKFPHLFTDGVILPENGFDTENYNDVPVLMVNGNREFSSFCKSSDPFGKLSEAELMQDAALLPEYKFAEGYGSMMYTYFNGEESATRMVGRYDAPIYTCSIIWGDNPEVCGEEYATIWGSYHCMTTALMTHVLNNAAVKYPDLYASASCKNVSTMLNTYYKNFIWTGDPNSSDLPTWEPWTSLDGTTQLIVDATDEGATAVMSTDHITYEQIFEMMDADTSISEEEKQLMISTVMNGRWFSTLLDEHYGNESLWVTE